MILTSWCSYKVRYILKSFVYTGALPAFKTLSTSLTRKSALINSPGLLTVCLVTMEPGNEQPSVVLAREFLGQRSSHLLIFSLANVFDASLLTTWGLFPSVGTNTMKNEEVSKSRCFCWAVGWPDPQRCGVSKTVFSCFTLPVTHTDECLINIS